MQKPGKRALAALIRGLAAAIGLTLMLTALIALIAATREISDGTILALNQVMKACALTLGVLVAVGRGGQRGFVTGMATGILYMALGYGCATALGGGPFDAAQMLGEILIGSALGAVVGAILANLPRRTPARAA